ncbi:MAG: hypothetical protein N2110_03955 [Flavobacteriales bacterium]|nr:hypothetical protein [Flavobacteriales bacterium]MCX7768164.1 hypothetical protein [Flavobacteriales bacterium]MDW8409116.1 hypothetical protein [Flavobacteriales bacterium]
MLHTPLSPDEIVLKLSQVIFPFRWYFLFSPATQLPYSGRFEGDGFVAIKNAYNKYIRSIKVIGKFYIVNNKIYVRLIFSNPFSIINIGIVLFFYVFLYLLRIPFFPSVLANVLVYSVPLILAYLATNLSFQKIYKKEKMFFFRLFEGRRLKEDEISILGI